MISDHTGEDDDESHTAIATQRNSRKPRERGAEHLSYGTETRARDDGRSQPHNPATHCNTAEGWGGWTVTSVGMIYDNR